MPLISYKQMLEWVDGRNASTIRGPAGAPGPHVRDDRRPGCERPADDAPHAGPGGTLSALTCNGSPKTYTTETIKGIEYARFDAVTGTCQATYS